MNIEPGEHFVVTRGFEYGPPLSLYSIPVFSPFGAPEKDENPRYDRSHEGRVFVALSVAGPVIACECVFATGYKAKSVGEKFSLNTGEIEVWPVTDAYVNALLDSPPVKETAND